MRSTITLNGKNSSEIAGLLIQTLPPISKPLMRTQIEEIDGRDGDIVTKLGFSAYKKEFTIGLYGDYDVDQVIGYFNSEGTVIFSNEPDKYYYYQIVDQIDFEKLIRFKTATVTMHCQPFKYSTTETPEIFENVENLVSIPNFTKTTNGITVSAVNGIISINGTGSAATEFYIPITSLTLSEGDYVLRALATGTSPEACSLRVIYNSPSAANSFGGTYTTLQNNTTVSIAATLSQVKTYNYIYLYISPNTNLDFTLDLRITVAEGLVSDEGNFLNLQETSLASFNKFDLKGGIDQANYSGKNIFDYELITSGTQSGVTFTNDSGVFSIHGTATASIDRSGFIPITDAPASLIKAGQTYTLSTNKPLPTGTLVSVLFYSDTAWKADVVRLDGNGARLSVTNTANIPSGSTRVRYLIHIGNGIEVDIDGLTIQLERNNSVTDYEPYVGGTDSPNPDYPQDVKVVSGNQSIRISSKNLQSVRSSTTTNGITFTTNPDGSITINGTTTGSAYFNLNNTASTRLMLKKGLTYTLSAGVTLPQGVRFVTRSVSSPATLYMDIYGTNTSGATKTIEQDVLTFTYIAIYNAGTTINNLTIYPQLEVGSTATTFEPHSEQNYTVDLGDIELDKIGDFQDYIYKGNDGWYVHKEIGKQNINTNNLILRDNYTNVEYGVYAKPSDYGGYGAYDYGYKIVCTHAIFERMPTGGWDTTAGIGGGWVGAEKPSLWFGFAKGTGLNNIKAALTGAVLYYQLGSPTDTKITDSTLVGQLEALDSQAYSYGSATNLVSSSSNFPIIMSVEAIRANKATIMNRGNTTAKPVLTIYGAGDIGVYLNGFQVFTVALGDEGYITIDTNQMEAYKDSPDNLKNRLVDGDFTNFVLPSGESQITFSGSVDRCVIENYSRWL